MRKDEKKEPSSAETLLSAARRVVRFFNIDMNRDGGLVSIDTQQAVETLDMQVSREQQRLDKLNASH